MIRSFNVQELVEKEVVPFGNGSIVYTPKKWVGKKVYIVLEKQSQEEVQEGILKMLKNQLKDIEGIYLFGSFARDEQTTDSDIDVLVVPSKKITLKNEARFDFLIKTKDEIAIELKHDNQLFLHQVIQEAKPILNAKLLDEIKKTEAKPNYKEFLEDTIGAFKNTQDLLQASQKQGLKYLDSNATIYSLILRFRGLILAQALGKRKTYSNKTLLNALNRHDFTKRQAQAFLDVYRAERDNKKTPTKILVADAEKLFESAKKEFIQTERTVTTKWAEKTNTKKG